MIQKLNLATPDEDLVETIDYEAERAVRWYEKKKKNAEDERYQLYSKACGKDINVATEPVEWVSPQTDNHWLIFDVGVPLPDKTGMRWFPIELCYYETIGSIGAFAYLDIVEDEKLIRRTYLVFSSHFFLRYRKRMNLTHEGKDLLIHFFINNPTMHLEFEKDLGQFYKHKGQCCMNIIYNDGVAYCKIHKGNEVVEQSTFLPHEYIVKSEKERLADLYHSFNPENYKSKEQIEMTKLFHQSFQKTLKEYGLKTKFKTMCEEAFDVPYAQYLDFVEPIYALSRVQYKATDINKVKECNKIWTTTVVKCGWQPQLQPYTDKYGTELTYRAISYLIDNDLWQTPKGDAGLRVKTDKHWDGIKMIDDAVTYLTEQDTSLLMLIPDNAQEEIHEEPTPEPLAATPAEVSQEDEQDEPITPNDIAMAIATDMATAMRQVKEKLDTLNKTIENNKELTELNAQKEKVADLTRQLSQKETQIEKLKKDYQSAQDRYINKSKDYDALTKSSQDLFARYKDEHTRCEELERIKEDLNKQIQDTMFPKPVKRVFTYSELHAVPLIGDGIIQSLDKFFFTKKGIVIDYNK